LPQFLYWMTSAATEWMPMTLAYIHPFPPYHPNKYPRKTMGSCRCVDRGGGHQDHKISLPLLAGWAASVPAAIERSEVPRPTISFRLHPLFNIRNFM
jgi:hypothetical protein